jgi:hypothetical protein
MFLHSGRLDRVRNYISEKRAVGILLMSYLQSSFHLESEKGKYMQFIKPTRLYPLPRCIILKSNHGIYTTAKPRIVGLILSECVGDM